MCFRKPYVPLAWIGGVWGLCPRVLLLSEPVVPCSTAGTGPRVPVSARPTDCWCIACGVCSLDSLSSFCPSQLLYVMDRSNCPAQSRKQKRNPSYPKSGPKKESLKRRTGSACDRIGGPDHPLQTDVSSVSRHLKLQPHGLTACSSSASYREPMASWLPPPCMAPPAPAQPDRASSMIERASWPARRGSQLWPAAVRPAGGHARMHRQRQLGHDLHDRAELS
jgi:hypothetical protein